MIRVVKLCFADQHIDDFKNFFHERKERIRAVSGCQYLELWQDIHDEGVFFTYSIWDTPEDLDHYRNSDLFNDTWSTVKKWFKHKPMAFSANQLMKLP